MAVLHNQNKVSKQMFLIISIKVKLTLNLIYPMAQINTVLPWAEHLSFCYMLLYGLLHLDFKMYTKIKTVQNRILNMKKPESAPQKKSDMRCGESAYYKDCSDNALFSACHITYLWTSILQNRYDCPNLFGHNLTS